MRRKAVSPVIATVLLIAIVVVIALIILIWALSFIKEACLKNGKSCDQNCDEISIQITLDSGVLTVINNGNIPIYSINIEKTSQGQTELDPRENIGIAQGTAKSFDIGEGYEKVEVTPIIMGEVKNTQAPQVCKNQKQEAIAE